MAKLADKFQGYGRPTRDVVEPLFKQVNTSENPEEGYLHVSAAVMSLSHWFFSMGDYGEDIETEGNGFADLMLDLCRTTERKLVHYLEVRLSLLT